MKLLLIINPVSGGTSKAEFLNKVRQTCRKYGFKIEVFKTLPDHKKTVEQIYRVVETFAPDRIAIAGGDGTLTQFLRAGVNSEIPIILIPMGSANGLATDLELCPQPFQAFLDGLLSRHEINLDSLSINNEFKCVHLSDVGINAQIVEDYEKDPDRGLITYAKYFVKQFRNQQRFSFQVTTPDETYEGTAVMVAICNGRRLGTGIPMNRKSHPGDGLFELVFIEEIEIETLLKAGLARFNASFLDSLNVKVIQAKHAQIAFENERLLQVDGETSGKHKTLDISVQEHACKVVVNGDCPYL